MLYFDEFHDIAKSVYKEKDLINEFEKDKELLTGQFQENNVKFYKESKGLKTLAGVGKTICYNINQCLNENNPIRNESIIRTRGEIRANIALLLHPEKIDRLIEFLEKVPNLGKWTPATLETFYRTKTREKDSHNIYDNSIFSENEKKELMALRSWIVSNIRKFNIIDYDYIKSTKPDWGKVKHEIEKRGKHEIANNFEEQIIFRSFEEAINELYELLLKLDNENTLKKWNLALIERYSKTLYVYLTTHFKEKNGGVDYNIFINALSEKNEKAKELASKFTYRLNRSKIY